MTLFDLQEKYKNNAKGLSNEIASMSRSQMKEIIDSCGTPQGKVAMKRQWEKLTGDKY